MSLIINTNELKQITGCLARLKAFDAVTTDPRLLKSIGQLLVARGKQNLEDGAAEGRVYTPLSPSTQKQKSRKGYSLKPLQRTGLMKRSISHEVASGDLKLVGLDIIKHHQWGAPANNLPRRQVFTVSPEDEEDIKDFLIRRFKQLNPELT